MTPDAAVPHRLPRRRAAALLAAAVLACGVHAWAQNPAPTAPTAATRPAPPRAATGSSWAALTPAQRTALAPLQREWNELGPEARAKWLQVAARYPAMSEEERTRLQARMAAWARMSPQERGQARLRYQQAQSVPAQERQERWEQYQALPPEQRRRLAHQWADKEPPRKAESRTNNGNGGNGNGNGGATRTAQPKSNLVPNTSYAAAPKAVAPTVVQGKPGATTHLITRPPRPPLHQQTGLPKIAATPGFVDRTTLLPQRGLQGAATGPARPASGPEPRR